MLGELSRGDFPPNPLDKPGYQLEFHDEFDEPELDTTKWLPFYLPHWSSRVLSTPRYTIADSNLVLEIAQDQGPWCPEFDGEVRCSSIQTGSYSGAVGSKLGQHRFSDALIVREAQANTQLYTPQYGFFETRVKGLRTNANHASLWMIGYEDAPERSGEIALFELLGAQRSPTRSGVRYGLHPWGDPTITDGFYEDYFDIDTAQFHIYAVEWTPTRVDFTLDNVKIRTIAQSPGYPMQFMLSLYELPFADAWTGAYNPDDPYPKTFTVDYVRGYQPMGGYAMTR
ncbi:MAG: glycoside hydrolase family 16 protein [Anaerolineae bacterium]|nr:glycoside hydrolase family 16 protein [Anaerolineae bacterium]